MARPGLRQEGATRGVREWGEHGKVARGYESGVLGFLHGSAFPYSEREGFRMYQSEKRESWEGICVDSVMRISDVSTLAARRRDAESFVGGCCGELRVLCELERRSEA